MATLIDVIARQALDLSYGDIQKEHPTWSKVAIDDYFYKQSNINSLAISGDEITEQVLENTENIAINAANIAINTQDILNLEFRVLGDSRPNSYQETGQSYSIGDYVVNPDGDPQLYYKALVNIAAPAGAFNPANWQEVSLQENENRIKTNEGDISTNATNISNNTGNITTVTTNFNNHDASNSEHGVAGDNVGTLDFATSGTGGVVNLAALVNDAVASAVSVTSPDATDLPSVITLANEMKGDVNQLVTDLNNAITQLNDLIDKMKTANQMSAI
jgi:hypothetical protein